MKSKIENFINDPDVRNFAKQVALSVAVSIAATLVLSAATSVVNAASNSIVMARGEGTLRETSSYMDHGDRVARYTSL